MFYQNWGGADEITLPARSAHDYHKVKITIFPGGTLTEAYQCHDGVVDGISERKNRTPVIRIVRFSDYV